MVPTLLFIIQASLFFRQGGTHAGEQDDGSPKSSNKWFLAGEQSSKSALLPCNPAPIRTIRINDSSPIFYKIVKVQFLAIL
jgi:hypothetical protein